MKDPRIEQWLNKEGVLWHYEENIPLTKIDREASLKNQARFKAIDQDHVLELAIAAEQYQLPALLGYYGKTGRIIVISGNHRMEAYPIAGISKTDFYIIDITHPWVIDRLTRVANTLEGEPLSREERLAHATYLIKSTGISGESAAKMLGLPRAAVSSALEASDTKERLARLGFTERIAVSTLININRIKQNEALLETARLIHEAQLSSEEAREIAKRVQKSSGSEKAQLVVLGKARQEYQTRIAKLRRGQLKTIIIPTIQLRKAVNIINRLRPDAVKPLDADLRKRIAWVIKKLEEVISDETK